MPQKRNRADATALPALVDGLHTAALDGSPGAWTGALERVADAFGARAVYLQPYGGGTTGGSGALMSVRVDPAWARSYVGYYGALDPVLPVAIPGIAPGGAMAGRRAMDPSALWRTEYGHDWCRPQGMEETALGLLTRGESDPGGGWGLLVLSRGAGAGPFGSGELRRVSALLPHLRRAVAVKLRLGAAMAERDALTAALDLDPRGAVLVDAEGRVLFANRAAETVLTDPGAALARSADGTLRGAAWAGPRLDEALRRLLAAAAGRAGSDGLRPGGALPLPARPVADGAGAEKRVPRAAALKAIPLDRRAQGRGPATALVLIEGEPGADRPVALASRYGLTPAEARVAELVARDGLAVKALARALGVSPTTARTHLQRLFEKTGTHRQAELVARLRDGAPP